MNPFLVAIVAIIAWALVQITRNRADGAPVADLELRLLELDEAFRHSEAERKRLTERVQNLEAIVTTETYELARHDRQQAATRIELPAADDPAAEDETPEAQAARLARRMRT